jgi:hypothetical protein
MSKYQRSQPVITRNSDENISEDHWLKQFEKSLQKDAVQPRTQQSLFDQINSIMNQKSKYPSVEAAVEDMKERSGLTAYLTKVKISEVGSQSTVKTAQKSPKEAGVFDGEEDLTNHGFGSDILSSLHSRKNFPQDQKSWMEYARGYIEGSKMSKEHQSHELKRLDTYFEKQTKKSADDNKVIEKKVKMPLVIKKHPTILKTLENCIRDSKGNLPIPAIIERVRSIHQGDVSEAKDWDEDDLMYLVSQLNLDAKKNNPASYEDYSNLGGRDSLSDGEVDPSNTDAFYALNPAKI